MVALRFILAVLVSGCASQQQSAWLTAEVPPGRYQANTTAIVRYSGWLETERICTEWVGSRAMACASIDGSFMWIVNPCDVIRYDRSQWYAGLKCHEVGHLNGWSAGHSR